MKTNNLSRIIMILMLVLMGSVQAMAQGLKIKRFSYAKSGETLKGEQIYARTDNEELLEAEQGYSPYPWILYLENGGSVQFELPDSQKHTHQVVPVVSGMHSFTYHNGKDMYIDVNVVPYAVPYLGELRLQGSISNDSVHLEKTVSEEDFFTYTIKSDSSLMQFIKINPQGGYDIDGNLGIHAALTQRFPESGYKYAIRLSSEQERLFADGVSVKSLKDMAVLQGLNPNDFVLQIGIDNAEGASIFSEVYRDQARLTKKTTFLRIIDKRQKYYTLKAVSSNETLGTVEPAELKVKAGGEVTFTATAKENAIFKGWKKGSAEVSVTGSVLKLTNVQEASEWTAVFEKKASTPEVGAVDLQFGQREAILTWAPGSATSWQIKLYRSDAKLVKTILTQLPRVELESLVPGEVYRYELVAKRQGKLDSQVKQGTFKTDQFNEREALAPYLKNFSKLLRGKAFDLIWMDVNLSEFYQETPIYEYYWQLNETSPKVLLIPDGKQLTLDTNQVGGCLIILIKSGDTLLYEVRYELDK